MFHSGNFIYLPDLGVDVEVSRPLLLTKLLRVKNDGVFELPVGKVDAFLSLVIKIEPGDTWDISPK